MAKVKPVKRKKNWLQDNFEALLFAFVVAMIIRNYTFQNFKIPSESMVSTLLVGDYLVANKMKYFFTDPERGDIVTFRYPADPIEPEPHENFVKLYPPIYYNKTEANNLRRFTLMHLTYYSKKNVVKRVIGMPGDTVKIVNKQVYINGELYKTGKEHFTSSYVVPRSAGLGYAGGIVNWDKDPGSKDNFGPVVVPEGKYFVLGDNRDNSADSRYWGFLDRKDITGTPALIFFSVDENTHKVRWDRFFKIIK